MTDEDVQELEEIYSQPKRQVTRSNFTLLKVSKVGGGSISYTYKTSFNDGGVVNENIHDIKSTFVAHPDLLSIFDDLTDIYIKSKGYDVVHNIANSGIKESDLKCMKSKAVEKVLSMLNVSQHTRIDSYSISIQNKDSEIVSAVVSAKEKQRSGHTVGSATHRIELKGTSVMGIEEELLDCCERLREEVYCFAYEGKHNQVEIDFENPPE